MPATYFNAAIFCFICIACFLLSRSTKACDTGECITISLPQQKETKLLLLRNAQVILDNNGYPVISLANNQSAALKSSVTCCMTKHLIDPTSIKKNSRRKREEYRAFDSHWFNCPSCPSLISFSDSFQCRGKIKHNSVMFIANRWSENSVYHGMFDTYFSIWLHLK